MQMNLILDIILVLLFLVIVLISTIRGFVRSVWRTITVIGAFALAYMYGPTIGSYLYENYVCDYVTDYTFESLSEIVDDSQARGENNDILENVPEELLNLLEHCGANLEEVKDSIRFDASVSEETLYNAARSISDPIANTISVIVGMRIVFVVGVIAISLGGVLLRLIVKLPIIRFIDTTLGALFGIAEAFVVVWVVCLAISFFVEHGFITGETNEAFYVITANSRLLKFFCNLSPVDFINIRVE